MYICVYSENSLSRFYAPACFLRRAWRRANRCPPRRARLPRVRLRLGRCLSRIKCAEHSVVFVAGQRAREMGWRSERGCSRERDRQVTQCRERLWAFGDMLGMLALGVGSCWEGWYGWGWYFSFSVLFQFFGAWRILCENDKLNIHWSFINYL